MGHPWDSELGVLHTLQLRGFAEPQAVVRSTGFDRDEVVGILERGVAAGLVRRREGRISGYALTAEGGQRVRSLVVAELAAGVDGHQLRLEYEAFLALNPALLATCTDWQLHPAQGAGGSPRPNDHTDAAYDRQVITRLGRIDDAVQPHCGELASLLDRFSRYGGRLAYARGRVEAGDGDWFTRPGIDSYHTVWFELHEDLLTSLGIERSKEGQG